MEAPASQQRWLSLDVFRGLAVLLMIQGHTFTALLRLDAYDSAWAGWHKILHGLTAPMFLLGGGIAYGLSSLSNTRSTAEPCMGDELRVLRRATMLIALGYALQVPRVPWSRIFAEHELLALTLRVGPLQLVGMCLLIGEALRLSLRARPRVFSAITMLTLGIVASAPLIWRAHGSERLPLLVGTWLDGYAGSLFPFFPWAAFFFVGVLSSRWISVLLREHRGWLAISLCAGGASGAAFAYAMYVHGYWMRSLYGDYELWHTSPLYVLFRAGLVLAGLGLLAALEPATRWLWHKAPRIERAFGVLSKHSLVAYVTHLLVLYGTPLSKALASYGTTFDLIAVSGITCGVLAFTLVITTLWSRAMARGALWSQLTALARRVLPARMRQVNGIGERHWLDTAATKQPIEPAASTRHGV